MLSKLVGILANVCFTSTWTRPIDKLEGEADSLVTDQQQQLTLTTLSRANHKIKMIISQQT